VKLESLSFRDYARRSIPVSLLAESIYCEAKVSNRQLLGEIETPILLEGRRLHEQDAKKALRKFGATKKAKVVTLEDALLLSYTNVALALKKRKIIANSEKKKLFISIIPDHGILGFPDFVDCKDGKPPVIVEQKNCKRIPSSPWPDHQIQVVAYSMSLEVLGFNPPHAILEYVTRDKVRTKVSYQVPIDANLKKRTVEISRKVFSMLQGEEPNATTNTNKCIPCAYASQCKWSPLRLLLT
jgi:CRISPR/Cas system-associated exonuclease Cas4 (RecB family)